MQAWFISREGKEEGPLTAAQIGTMLSAGVIRAGDTLARKQEATDWKKLAESGVLAEASMADLKRPDGLPVPSAVKAQMARSAAAPVGQPADPAPAAAPAGSTLKIDPYQTPANFEVGPGFQDGPIEYPGIGRLAYFLLQMAVTVITYALLFIGIKISAGSGLEGIALVGMVAIFLGTIVGFYLGVKRVQNLGMSGWAILWSFVPIMSIWIGWRMYACPPGYEYHRELDAAGKVLTWVMVGLVILMVVLNIAAVFLGDSSY
ncbi:GYF domain-containing protein [Haloferula sp. A504]|uniref:GYF domain-containing protein n=1 Tax=Haloferula sp. A504 TaxID=3373601 RepID=UPI0031C9BA9E|nr:GYF domain-containing protein [Verrucomicrobiaceae bacterium E54]